MLFAISADGKKIAAQPGMNALCPNCNSSVIAKCGDINIHHWAHESLNDCDAWLYEPITQWHLDWQENYPLECREVVVKSAHEAHRADILQNGKVIEIQNSPISPDTIFEREQFYNNVCWVINAEKFKHNLSFTAFDIDYDKELSMYIAPTKNREHFYTVQVPLFLDNRRIFQALKENHFVACDEDDYEEEFWQNRYPIYNKELPKSINTAFKQYILDDKLKERLERGKNFSTNFHWKNMTKSWLYATGVRLLDLNNGYLFCIKTLQ